MGEWTGHWKCGISEDCECECGKVGGAKRQIQTFDSEHIDSLRHDGETRVCISYVCEECKRKFGSERYF